MQSLRKGDGDIVAIDAKTTPCGPRDAIQQPLGDGFARIQNGTGELLFA